MYIEHETNNEHNQLRHGNPSKQYNKKLKMVNIFQAASAHV